MMLTSKKLFLLLLIVKLRTVKCDIQGNVVDGNYAKIEDFPHSVYLHVDCGSSWICGGSILNQRIVLTAAHCVYNSLSRNYCNVTGKKGTVVEAFIGHEDLRKVVITRKAHDLIGHVGFDDYTVENDIAVVMFKDKIPFGKNVKRIFISKKWTIKERHGLVAGWGIMDETSHNSYTMKLISVYQKLRSHQTCEVMGDLSPGMFCAGSTGKNDPHPSSGDSGSAFVCRDAHQIGIVSFKGYKYPALMVYTNVTYYYKWIKKNAELLFCRNKKIIP